MKAFLGILLSALFLLTTTQEVAFIMLYQWNKKSITENYCINKNNKKLNCKGRCHLNKVITASENNKNKNPFSNSTYKSKGIETIYQKLPIIDLTTFIAASSFNFSNNTFALLAGACNRIIKPPIV
ncbi:MAG TPA: hypothetical protein PKM51_08275 [Chitinophagales bacterium]|nr:hypothetical protein [Chitinophagales bacterium]HNM32735.1 hypothetical protein [Chitinophagales bacterium]